MNGLGEERHIDFESATFSLKHGERPIAIAEVGVNHNMDMSIARRLIDEAQTRGADVVKFQAFVAEEEISRFAEKAEYQKATTGAKGGQLEMAKALELSSEQLRVIRDYCSSVSMPFLCSVFDMPSLRFLVSDLRVKTIKIASSEVTNHPFLAEIAKTGVSCILSTGASELSEVGEAVKVMRSVGVRELVLFHCVSNYPADIQQINLRAMETLRSAFDLPVGYSDHTVGIEAPIAAAALGAVAVEKHFTLDRRMEGPDHLASVEPFELEAMVRGMRAAYSALGDGQKRVAPCEEANRLLIRKSIVVRRDLPEGHVLAEDDLTAKRPLGGIEPPEFSQVVGRRLARALLADEPVRWGDLA